MRTVPFTAQPDLVTEPPIGALDTPPLTAANGTCVLTAIRAITITAIATATLSFFISKILIPFPTQEKSSRFALGKRDFVC
jgi:hypothetical protein